jgi:hypothetical protein
MNSNTSGCGPRRASLASFVLLALATSSAFADDSSKDTPDTGGKLLLTSGVTQIEGAAGGGLTPWAVIGGQGSFGQIGASAFYTRVSVGDYHLDDAGLLIGINDRVEISFAQQRFNTEKVGGLLGLGDGFTLKQDIVGVKLRVAGDAVLDSDSKMPQISVGVQYKRNNQAGVLAYIGAKDNSGTDFYVSATKLFLADGFLLNGTVRFTKANQIGILGFGGDKHNGYQPQLELSAAYLISRKVAIGAEYRMKPNNLGIAKEDDWFDVFVAYQPTRNVSVTFAYADLGNIVIRDHQRGLYASLQVGF